MKITKASDYAIRLLTHLASMKGEATSEALAKKLDIPFSHLAKLVQKLARRRYLITRKGKGGGLKLAVDPRTISVADIVEIVEGPIVISDCIFHRESCRFSENCKARKCLANVRYKMQEILAATSVFDLAPSA